MNDKHCPIVRSGLYVYRTGNVIKIGRSKDLQKRLRTHSSSVAGNSIVIYLYFIPNENDNLVRAEKELNDHFDEFKITGGTSREHFSIEVLREPFPILRLGDRSIHKYMPRPINRCLNNIIEFLSFRSDDVARFLFQNTGIQRSSQKPDKLLGFVNYRSYFFDSGMFSWWEHNRRIDMKRVRNIIKDQKARYRSQGSFTFCGTIELFVTEEKVLPIVAKKEVNVRRIKVIDGQHRLAAVKDLLNWAEKESPDVRSDEISVEIGTCLYTNLRDEKTISEIFEITNRDKELVSEIVLETDRGKRDKVIEFGNSLSADLGFDKYLGKRTPNVNIEKLFALLLSRDIYDKVMGNTEKFLTKALKFRKSLENAKSYKRFRKLPGAEHVKEYNFNRARKGKKHFGMYNNFEWIPAILA